MTTFIHASDLHLDSPMKGLEQYEGAPDIEEIKNATRQALINLVDFALNEQVPLVVIAGDLYDGDWPDFSTGLFFSQQMQRLSRAGIRVSIAWGNHDAQNKMTKTLVMPKNVHVFSARKPETIVYEDLHIAVHGQSYATAETTQNLAADYPEPKPGMFNIGLLHCLLSVLSATSPTLRAPWMNLHPKGTTIGRWATFTSTKSCEKIRLSSIPDAAKGDMSKRRDQRDAYSSMRMTAL